MNIGIVGARKFQDRQSVINLVNALNGQATIITSKCSGVCSWTIEAAAERDMKVMVYEPDLQNVRSWFDVPKRYYNRNRELVEACDILYAFASKEGLTGGTSFEVAYAIKLGIPVQLCRENGIVQIMYQSKFSFMETKYINFMNDWQLFFRQTLS